MWCACLLCPVACHPPPPYPTLSHAPPPPRPSPLSPLSSLPLLLRQGAIQNRSAGSFGFFFRSGGDELPSVISWGRPTVLSAAWHGPYALQALHVLHAGGVDSLQPGGRTQQGGPHHGRACLGFVSATPATAAVKRWCACGRWRSLPCRCRSWLSCPPHPPCQPSTFL